MPTRPHSHLFRVSPPNVLSSSLRTFGSGLIRSRHPQYPQYLQPPRQRESKLSHLLFILFIIDCLLLIGIRCLLLICLVIQTFPLTFGALLLLRINRFVDLSSAVLVLVLCKRNGAAKGSHPLRKKIKLNLKRRSEEKNKSEEIYCKERVCAISNWCTNASAAFTLRMSSRASRSISAVTSR